MKKIIGIIFGFIEIILILGAYIVNFYTTKKMGMLRYIVNKNTEFEKNYPMKDLKVMLITIILLLLVVVIYRHWHKKLKFNGKLLLSVFMVVLYTVFSIFFSINSVKAYYYILFLCGIGTLLQLIKNIITLD